MKSVTISMLEKLVQMRSFCLVAICVFWAVSSHAFGDLIFTAPDINVVHTGADISASVDLFVRNDGAGELSNISVEFQHDSDLEVIQNTFATTGFVGGSASVTANNAEVLGMLNSTTFIPQNLALTQADELLVRLDVRIDSSATVGSQLVLNVSVKMETNGDLAAAQNPNIRLVPADFAADVNGPLATSTITVLQSVPEPSALFLFGMLGLAFSGHRFCLARNRNTTSTV